MFARKGMMRKVSTSAVLSAGIMLLGILFTAYGYFQNAGSVLYVGLFITLAGVLSGIIRVVIRGKV
jgi:hypothetical protein